MRGIPGGTLLLINGRRTANPDLNAIPLGAIERIEILKDGGSSIYGADAVAGVMNIILRRDFQGAEFAARYGNTTERDAGEQLYSFLAGTATENTSVVFAVATTRPTRSTAPIAALAAGVQFPGRLRA